MSRLWQTILSRLATVWGILNSLRDQDIAPRVDVMVDRRHHHQLGMTLNMTGMTTGLQIPRTLDLHGHHHCLEQLDRRDQHGPRMRKWNEGEGRKSLEGKRWRESGGKDGAEITTILDLSLPLTSQYLHPEHSRLLQVLRLLLVHLAQAYILQSLLFQESQKQV